MENCHQFSFISLFNLYFTNFTPSDFPLFYSAAVPANKLKLLTRQTVKAFANPGENLPATSLTGISASSEKDCILVADFDRRYVRQFTLHSKQSKIVYRAAPQRKPRAVLRLLYTPIMFMEQNTNVEKIAIVELNQNSGASFLVIASKDAATTGDGDGEAAGGGRLSGAPVVRFCGI